MGVDRTRFIEELEALAPLRLAEGWDNVGLLVDDGSAREVQKVFVTIDLVEKTLAEAFHAGADFIVAYHPPIFSGLKRLTAHSLNSRIPVQCIRREVAVYSPHTALDAVSGGMNDWLISCLDPKSTRPIAPNSDDPRAGGGRIGELKHTLAIDEVVQRIKKHLGLNHVRLSAASESVSRVAVCPGAGGSLFESMSEHVDLLLTGEMRHHDVLAQKRAETNVILTDHTNTERGFLPHFAELIRQRAPGIEVIVSTADADPLQVV